MEYLDSVDVGTIATDTPCIAEEVCVKNSVNFIEKLNLQATPNTGLYEGRLRNNSERSERSAHERESSQQSKNSK